MPECWICGRATGSCPDLPLNICRRAGCLPERRHLYNALHETEETFYWIGAAAGVPGSGIERAGGAA